MPNGGYKWRPNLSRTICKKCNSEKRMVDYGKTGYQIKNYCDEYMQNPHPYSLDDRDYLHALMVEKQD